MKWCDCSQTTFSCFQNISSWMWQQKTYFHSKQRQTEAFQNFWQQHFVPLNSRQSVSREISWDDSPSIKHFLVIFYKEWKCSNMGDREVSTQEKAKTGQDASVQSAWSKNNGQLFSPNWFYFIASGGFFDKKSFLFIKPEAHYQNSMINSVCNPSFFIQMVIDKHLLK